VELAPSIRIAVSELPCASHAKPWVECASAAECLNVFNQFLLPACFGVLFDRHLMTFSGSGEAVFASKVDQKIP
jgi:starvation-inducible outer membrane lipoprotein